MHRPDPFIPENKFKLVMLGNSCVGKSSITRRFIDGEFVENHIALLDQHIKTFTIDEKRLTLEIVDLIGAEEYIAIQEEWIKKAKAVVLVYSVDDEKSFQEVKSIKKRIDRVHNFQQILAMLVGNKCDLQNRAITYEQGQALAKDFGISYMETSAKTGMNCRELFENLALSAVTKKTRREKKKNEDCNLI